MKNLLIILNIFLSINLMAQNKKAVIILDVESNNINNFDNFRNISKKLRTQGWDVYEFYSNWNKPSEGGKVFDANNKNLIKYSQNADLFIYQGHGNSDFIIKNDTTYPFVCGTENGKLNFDGISFKNNIKLNDSAVVIFLLSCTTSGSSYNDGFDYVNGKFTKDIGFDEAFRRVSIYRNYFKKQTYIATNNFIDISNFIFKFGHYFELKHGETKETRNNITIFKNEKTNNYFRSFSF